MADIFLSYARVDRRRILPLVQALDERGWSVWWDLHIPFGKSYEKVIEEELDAARCVIVVWSQTAVNSRWVKIEADEGIRRDVLVPIMIDAVRLPLAFRGLQTAQLVNWQGDESHEEFGRVMRHVARLVGVAPPIHSPAPLPLTNSIDMEFVLIQAGEFQMGSNDGDDDERPVHLVRISQPFYLGTYPVTQAQWEAIMGNNPSHFTGEPNRPVEQVSWDDVQEFVQKLHAKEGGTTYRLPTEAEWEYACRAGSTTAYSFGDDPSQLGAYAWYDANSNGETHPVGQLKANSWGLYDMHGNVWEWVHDWYGAYTAAAATDPQGPSSGSYGVIRGGSWYNDARSCRSAFRHYWHPGDRAAYLGFRLLRTASQRFALLRFYSWGVLLVGRGPGGAAQGLAQRPKPSGQAPGRCRLPEKVRTSPGALLTVASPRGYWVSCRPMAAWCAWHAGWTKGRRCASPWASPSRLRRPIVLAWRNGWCRTPS